MLDVQDLRVHYGASDGEHARPVRALDGVSFGVRRGESLGIVGESGSGKTTLALTLMGLASNGAIGGRISFDGRPLPIGDEQAMRRIRWRQIALAFQNAGSAFDPVQRIGSQIAEPIRAHLALSAADAVDRARMLLELVGLPPDRLHRYPHQLSGGEKQRAVLAMALACDPELLILDEPTAGQDVLTRVALVEMLQRLRRERGLTLVVISHDLTDVAALCDRVAVLYAGQIAELGPTRVVLDDPAHPYSWGLIGAYPLMTRAKDLWGIRGVAPDPSAPPSGCRFHPRCTQSEDVCRRESPELSAPDPSFAGSDRLIACHLGGLRTLLSVEGLRKTFRNGRSSVEAVRGASLTVREGEVVALVGQSGSGKTTLARLIVGLETPDAGKVIFQGRDLARRGEPIPLDVRCRIQLVFQDPYEALSPCLSVLELVREPLDVQRRGTLAERDEAARQALGAVNLPDDGGFVARLSHELSGGQLQRVALARALVLNPKLLIADEPVSMLDASERAKLLQLLKRLQNERGMAMLLISHDLALVRKVADRIAVMRWGEVVEFRPSHQIMTWPRHEYTRALIEASRGESPIGLVDDGAVPCVDSVWTRRGSTEVVTSRSASGTSD